MLAKDEILQERYRIIRRLGHGGMGAVYEARDERLGSSVALKEIIIDMDDIPTESQRDLFRRAFEREAKLLASLHHEVFPRVMDYFFEQNRQFLIMELVSGDDLSESLKKTRTPFRLEAAARWADHLLDALDYLHTQTPPIFHRDIKPQNLKVNFRGRIKLLDFGIAKSVAHGGSTLTNQTLVGATLEYAPIEQILPAITPTFREFIILKHNAKATAVLAQNTDARCDLYAVGATFYHLLTNNVPVDSAKRTLEIWEGSEDPLPNPSKANPDIPTAISAWLLKALEIERDNRFASADEMQKALHAALQQAETEKLRPQSQIETQQIISSAPPATAPPGRTQTEFETIQPLSPPSPGIVTEVLPHEAVTEFKTQEAVTEFRTQEALTELKTQEALTEFKTQEVVTELLTHVNSKARPSENVTAVLDEKLTQENRLKTQERKVEPSPVRIASPMPQSQAKTNFKIFGLAAVLTIALLGIIGFGGAFYLMKSAGNPANSGNAVSNANISVPSPTLSPSNSRSGETGVKPPTVPDVPPANNPTPTPSPTQKIVEEDKPKPTLAPTQNKAPVTQNPVKPPPTRNNPKTKSSQQDPNCVFTNSCQ